MDTQAEVVNYIQDWIRENLDRKITLAILSKKSGYSPWHLSRLFLMYTGYSLGEYVRKIRLSASALKLRDEKTTITDIAFESGFTTPESYQRAFRKEFGVNPKEYALNPTMIALFHPYPVVFSKKENIMKETTNIFITLIQKPARKVIIKRGIKAKNYMEYCEEVDCDIWGKLRSIKSISEEPVCMWLPKRFIAPGTSEYVQGTEVAVDFKGKVPEGFDVIELPATKYLMFQGEPFKEEDYCEAIEAVWSAIEKYDPKILGLQWDKDNPRIQLEPQGRRGYIELVAVK